MSPDRLTWPAMAKLSIMLATLSIDVWPLRAHTDTMSASPDLQPLPADGKQVIHRQMCCVWASNRRAHNTQTHLRSAEVPA